MLSDFAAAGKRALSGREPSVPSGPYRVRIWYVAADGEIRRCDSVRLTRQAAEALEWNASRGAVHVATYKDSDEPVLDGEIARLRSEAATLDRGPTVKYRDPARQAQAVAYYAAQAAEKRARADVLLACARALPVRLPSQGHAPGRIDAGEEAQAA